MVKLKRIVGVILLLMTMLALATSGAATVWAGEVQGKVEFNRKLDTAPVEDNHETWTPPATTTPEVQPPETEESIFGWMGDKLGQFFDSMPVVVKGLLIGIVGGIIVAIIGALLVAAGLIGWVVVVVAVVIAVVAAVIYALFVGDAGFVWWKALLISVSFGAAVLLAPIAWSWLTLQALPWVTRAGFSLLGRFSWAWARVAGFFGGAFTWLSQFAYKGWIIGQNLFYQVMSSPMWLNLMEGGYCGLLMYLMETEDPTLLGALTAILGGAVLQHFFTKLFDLPGYLVGLRGRISQAGGIRNYFGQSFTTFKQWTSTFPQRIGSWFGGKPKGPAGGGGTGQGGTSGAKQEISYGTQIGRVKNKKVLKPDVKYVTPEGYAYETDQCGRLVEAKGNLQLGEGKRNQYAQSNVGGGDRIKGDYPDRDDGGHLIGTQFKGSGDIDNLVPMNSQINQGGGKYYQLEQEWQAALEKGDKVQVIIKPQYSGSSTRPDSFEVEYSVNNGDPQIIVIQNKKGG